MYHRKAYKQANTKKHRNSSIYKLKNRNINTIILSRTVLVVHLSQDLFRDNKNVFKQSVNAENVFQIISMIEV